MARPAASTLDPVATTERLLAAAELEFARHGFDGTRLADVAARAGVRRPSLLYHFRSKDALYEAVVERVFGDLGRTLESAMTKPGSFQDRFEGVVGAFAAFLAASPHFATLVLRELMDDRGSGREILRHRLVPLLDRVEGFVQAAGTGGLSPRLSARAVVLEIASGVLLHAASGPLRSALWRDDHDPVALVRTIFFAPPMEA